MNSNDDNMYFQMTNAQRTLIYPLFAQWAFEWCFDLKKTNRTQTNHRILFIKQLTCS